MSTNRNRVTWKKDRIFSIRLRNGQHALLQMLQGRGQVAVFDLFQREDHWRVKLTKERVLFTCHLLQAVMKKSVVKTQGALAPVEGLEYEDTRIHIGDEWRELTVWRGTAEERTFVMMGEGRNQLRRISRVGGQVREEYSPIAPSDYDKYRDIELTNLCDYPSFNERLYLCSVLGRNIDPLKELAFSRPLRRECRVFIDIIAGKMPLSEFGY